MDKALRNTLYNTIVYCRQLLETDFRQQLEGHFGIHPDGQMEPLTALTHLDAPGRADRRSIEAAIAHDARIDAAPTDRKSALDRFIRESAFTCLNRLAALKLFEHPRRGLIMQAVGAGDQSKGFKQFALVAPVVTRGLPDGGYQLYLELLFDDLDQAVDVVGFPDVNEEKVWTL